MNQSSGLSVIALIIGIISIPIGCLTYAWIGLIVGVVGLIFSILALESAHSIRFLYHHFLSGITKKSLNVFYYA